MKAVHYLLGSRITLFVFLILFFVFPIAYFYIVAYNKTLQTATWINYLIFILIGFLFGLYIIRVRFYWIKNIELQKAILTIFKALIVFYGLFLFGVTISRYNRYLSEAIDLFYYHSAVWQLSEFKLPMFDNGSAPVWADHFEPIILFIAPFYWFIRNAEFLFSLQALIAISGAIPLYLSVKKILSSQVLAVSLSFSYLLFGGMQFGYAYGFHPIVFFPAVFFWTYYFYVSKNIKLYILFVFLSLFVKEEASFIMASWGLYIFLVRKDKVLGVFTGVAGALWFLLCFKIIFPFFNKGVGFRHFGQYWNSLLSPARFFISLITPSYKIDTILHTFGSFGFLVFLFPPAFIFIIPSLLEKLLSDNLAGASGAHYSAAITGLVLVATIECIYFLTHKLQKGKKHKIYIFLSGYLVYVAVSANLIYGYVGYSPFFLENKRAIPDVYVNYLNNTLQSIPPKATITALYQIAPRLDTYYKNVRVFPQQHENSDYVVVDLLIPPVLLRPEVLNQGLVKMDADKRYEIIVNNGGVVVYRLKSNGKNAEK